MTDRQKRLISIGFFGMVTVFLAIYLARIDYAQVARLTLDWPMLVVATFLAIGFRYWGVYIWRVILRDLGASSLPNFGILSAIYSKAWMGRYIPGKIPWIAGKIYLGGSLGISKARLAVSAILEGAIQVTALFAVSLLFLGLDPRLDVIPREIKIVLVGFAGLCLVVLTPRIFNSISRIGYLLIKKQEPAAKLEVSAKVSFRALYLYSIGAILSGTSFFLLVKAVDPSISPNLYIYCIGAYNLAGAVGMATPILPSGIGVRDGLLLVLLTIVLPADIAIALTVLSRLWSVAADVVFYLLATTMSRTQNVSSS